ncbi:contractile injection system protein, VgrG/Pvc8 family [Acidovorax sp. GBBC 3334]|uniref:contractile injection system protein, VgrG/Pvc8 family n=1 Tax=Acidovorax sp. GBBC 3334 TaxID=2940496 RepID=UPI002302E7CA|nr:contractile injection system protein, VgrG/Pvc8 family [Acidovorax sp. GBBC 3334]MDA8455272.1 contractile injection system protein, VgrG/Pvc8 family [Acidovorax sp. GBBC 3334]
MTWPNDARVFAHPAPDFELVVAGRNITRVVDARLISLTLAESRGDEADQLDIEIDDADGRMALPSKGDEIALRLGWAGGPLVDKGTFKVDEIEHGGSPDKISIRARSANLTRQLRTRDEHSYHDTTVGQIVRAIAARNGLQAKVDATLAAVRVAHIDQTHESDLHFATRLAKQYDAVCTVKKGRLAFIPINSRTNAAGADLDEWTLTRADGDQHRYHSAERNAYSGVRAYWHDAGRADKRSALVGTEENEKRLKDTYGSEADALAAARAEMQRVARGKATMELTLALGRPDLMPQTPLTVKGFKPQIDTTPWLVKKITHELGGNGLTSKLELETRTRVE